MAENAIDVLRNAYSAFGFGMPLAAREIFDQRPGAGARMASWYVEGAYRNTPRSPAHEFVGDDLFALPPRWEVTSVTPRNMTAHGDTVTVTGIIRCRPKGDLVTMTIPFVHIWTMCRDKAQRVVNYLEGIEIRREVELTECAA